jgi:hypothetical protein
MTKFGLMKDYARQLRAGRKAALGDAAFREEAEKLGQMRAEITDDFNPSLTDLCPTFSGELKG